MGDWLHGPALRTRGGVPLAVPCRRERVDRIHHIADTARSAVTHGPRSVSIPTTTCPATCSDGSSAQAAGACSATSACNRVMPSRPSGNRARASRRPPSCRPSGNRARASRRPPSSSSSTSWWSSAQSSPMNSTRTNSSMSVRQNHSTRRHLHPNDQVLTPRAGTTSHQQSDHRRTGRRTICQ